MSTPLAPPTLTHFRILAIDDDPLMHKIYQKTVPTTPVTPIEPGERVDDDPSKGKIFQRASPTTPVSPIESGKRVDDDPSKGGIFQRASPTTPVTPIKPSESLPAIQYQLEHAQSAKQGIEMIKTAIEAGSPYTMTYLDMRLPDLSGMEVARAIRKLDPLIMIVLVTAYEDHNLVEARHELGFNFEFFAKPIDTEELLSLTYIFTTYWQRTLHAHHPPPRA